MENKCLLDTELFDFFCEQFGEIKSHEIPAAAVTSLNTNASNNVLATERITFYILKAYNLCLQAQNNSMHFKYKNYDVLTQPTVTMFSTTHIVSTEEILNNITKSANTNTLRNAIEIEGDFNDGFIAVNYLTREQILCDIEWRLYACTESITVPAEISNKKVFNTETSIIEGDVYKLECIIKDKEYASHWCWTENIKSSYPQSMIHLGNEIPSQTIYPDTIPYDKQYFYITTKYKSANTTFDITLNDVDIYCSINNTNKWRSISDTTFNTMSLEENTKIYFKSNIISSSSYDNSRSILSFDGNSFIKTTGGNIMSLIYGDDFIGQTTVDSSCECLFYALFENNTSLISAKHLILPIKQAPYCCYWEMFYQCTSLIYAPEEISAIHLGVYACSAMFLGCTSLLYAPNILATHVGDSALNIMFHGCTSLKYVPDLHCMFCADSSCEGMFLGCTSLERAPKIPILTLQNYCCDNMFAGCTNLKYINAAFMDAPSSSCNGSWVEDVAATGTFVRNTNANWTTSIQRGINTIPSGWTIVSEIPDIPYEYAIEYLQSTGTQYIETGIVPTATTGIHTYAVCSNSTDSFIVGSRTNSSNTRWTIGHSSSGFYYGYGTYQTSNQLGGTTAELWLNYKNDKKFKASYNGTTKTENLPTLSFSPTYNIRLFGSAGVNATYSKWSGKLYYVQITDNNSITMELIPVCIGSTGYMYDKKSKLLYKNSGTGSFTLGPKIIPIEYLESSGTQYIDIPFTHPSSNGFTIAGEIAALHPNNNTYSIFSAVQYAQFEAKFKSFSNNIVTYDSTVSNTSVNGDWKMKLNERQSFSISNIYVESPYTYTYVSRSLGVDLTGFRIFGGYRNTNRYPIRLYNINFTHNEIIFGAIFDLIPVKVNNIGYLYDKTEGKLYGNSGTGNFILGMEL